MSPAPTPPLPLVLIIVAFYAVLQMRGGKSGAFDVALTTYECLMGKLDRWAGSSGGGTSCACHHCRPTRTQRTAPICMDASNQPLISSSMS